MRDLRNSCKSYNIFKEYWKFENHWIPNKNYENYENHIIQSENHENHENLGIPVENT